MASYKLLREDLSRFAPRLPAELLQVIFAKLDVISLARCSQVSWPGLRRPSVSFVLLPMAQVCRAWRDASWSEANFGAVCNRLRTHRPLFMQGDDITRLGQGQRAQFRSVPGAIAPAADTKAPIHVLGSLKQPRHSGLLRLSLQSLPVGAKAIKVDNCAHVLCSCTEKRCQCFPRSLAYSS